jgi:hypothetical protein
MTKGGWPSNTNAARAAFPPESARVDAVVAAAIFRTAATRSTQRVALELWSDLMIPHRLTYFLAALVAAALAAPAIAAPITTVDGQLWDSEPDAWTRGNTADTSHFGWDFLETGTPLLSSGRILDDTTPDIGAPSTATQTRWFQGSNGVAGPLPTGYGHRSGSGNYYSGFGDADLANDIVTAFTPSSGSGSAAGFTTLVLQVIASPPSGMGANALADLSFNILSGNWTKQKGLYGTLANGTGVYWQEWTSPGADVPFSVRVTSATSSRGIDAIQVDTHWTSASAPVINARRAIGVPEPGAATLALVGCLSLALRRRTRRA